MATESLTHLINDTLKTLMAEKDYDTVVEKCTNALEQYPGSSALYISRSTAYQRLGQLGKAYKDSELAIVAAFESGKREKIGEGQLRRAIALVNLKRFDDALFSLEKAVEYSGEDTATHSIWRAKIKSSHGTDQYDPDLVTVDIVPQRVKIPEPVAKPKSADSDGKSTTAPPEPSSNPTPKSLEFTPVAPKPATTAGPIVDNVRYDWYQNGKNVDVSLFIKNAPKDKVQVEFANTSVSVSFPLATGSEFVYDFDPLCGSINTKESSFRVFGTKIELNLVKATDIKWATLLKEGAENTENEATKVSAEEAQKGLGVPSSSAFLYPSSSKSGPKNWDSVANDDIKEIEKTESDNDPNAFFRILYKNADPDTQRAMLKSYTESNGTALSTNWDEVSKKKMETSPPDGMEAKSWINTKSKASK